MQSTNLPFKIKTAGHLRMDLLLQKFVTHFDDVYGDRKQ